jgi:hypothetical protein
MSDCDAGYAHSDPIEIEDDSLAWHRVMEQASGALFDTDRKYRYYLWRTWDPSCTKLIFIMLNPSTADSYVDDPTIRRCIGFAKRDGFGGIGVLNLFAYRTSNPDMLTEVDDPKGPMNKFYIETLLGLEQKGKPFHLPGPTFVAAWGTWWHTNQKKKSGVPLPRLAVESFAHKAHVPLHCLGKTKDLQPRHPLYVKADQPLEVYSS